MDAQYSFETGALARSTIHATEMHPENGTFNTPGSESS
jgi:hypothetical protein